MFLLKRLKQVLLAVLCRLVDGLDGLERQSSAQWGNTLVLGVVLAIPDKLGARKAVL